MAMVNAEPIPTNPAEGVITTKPAIAPKLNVSFESHHSSSTDKDESRENCPVTRSSSQCLPHLIWTRDAQSSKTQVIIPVEAARWVVNTAKTAL